MEKVSVIMPCFNHAKFLADSVKGVLQQTHQDVELIIVDDCSKDESWERITQLAVRDSRVRSLRHERNRGPSNSRNDGMKLATGDFIGFCDADDIWEKNKLEHQLRLLRETPEYDVIYGNALIIDENGAATHKRFTDTFPLPAQPSGNLFSQLLKANFINIASVLVRSQCVRKAGYFDSRVRNVEDWWYWIQLARYCRFAYMAEPLVRYRVHSRSTNLVNQRGYALNRFKVHKRILKSFADLPRAQKASTVFGMGAELCIVGKPAMGRRLLWKAIGLSATDIRSVLTLCKAVKRLALS